MTVSPNKIVDRTTASVGILDMISVATSVALSSAFLRRWSLTIRRSAMTRSIATAILALTLVGCGGTYVDDKHNFERALKFQRPKDVQVLHSIYWHSPHFTDEHCYFLELQPAEGSTLFKALTSAQDTAPVTDETHEIPPSLAVERPKWFAPNPRSAYELWASTNQFRTFGVLRDKKDGRIFVYGQIL